MTIIEIVTQANGAHRNQSGAKSVPEGWALVPESLATPNFPFGELTCREIDGIMEITEWQALPIPEPEPEPEPDPENVDPFEAVDSMLVDHEYRITLMELGLTEMEV